MNKFNYIRRNRQESIDAAKARFWRQVEVRESGCWEWTSTRTSRGYGNFGINNRAVNAQRAAWIFTHGPITSDFLVLHKCNNAPCCRPDHLYLGNHQDNMRDRAVSQRTAARARHGRAKLTEEQVALIKSSDTSPSELAAIFNVTRNYISDIRSGRRWKDRS